MPSRTRSSYSTVVHPVLCGLLLLALILKGIIPVGYMPNFSERQEKAGFTLVLCTGQGAKTVHLSSDPFAKYSDSREHDQKDAQDHNSCPYAPGLATALIPVLTVVAAILALMMSLLIIPSVISLQYRINRSAFPTGPPSLLA